MRASRPVFLALLLVAGAASALRADNRHRPVRDRLHIPFEFLRHLLGQPDPLDVQGHTVALAPAAAALRFTLEDDHELAIALANGDVLIDQELVGHYARGGELESSWAALVREAGHRATPDVVSIAQHWEPADLSDEEAPAARKIRSRFARLTAGAPQQQARPVPPAAEGGLTIALDDLSNPTRLEPKLREAAAVPADRLRVTVPNGQARFGDYIIGSDETLTGNVLVLHGNADLYGTLRGNLATVDGDVIIHTGAVLDGDALAIDGGVRNAGGQIRGEIRTLSRAEPAPARPAAEQAPSAPLAILRNGAGLLGVFLTLLVIGFGVVLFARSNLEVVADTVSHSFGRAFLAGLVAQMLVLPTFGMLVVGLILSVVGVLLLPFAVIVYVLLVILGVLGGFLAVAHAMGENYTRRRLAQGAAITTANSYRYVATGLAGLLVLWAAWVLFGWVPVAGAVIKGSAFLATWVVGTAGFGATLLSRAGARESFAGRLIPAEALTDEYLWATPQFGVPAARRPGSHRTPPPL